MSKEIELLTEIRDLLQVMAEPALEKRDAKLRTSLRKLVGGSEKKAKAVLLMDGSRSRAQIVQQSGIDQGDLSRIERGATSPTARTLGRIAEALDADLRLVARAS